MPVTGYVGLPGTGKTLVLVQRALEARAKGMDVFANFRLGSRADGYMVPLCDYQACGEWHSSTMHDADRYTFLTRTPLLAYYARWLGWRRGQGFVADSGVTLLESWEQVLAIRAAHDELGASHRLHVVKRMAVTDDDKPRIVWEAERACRVWNCGGCSKGIVIALDELNLWAPSRLWQELGFGVLNRWAYVRKDGLHVMWTSQHEARIDKVAREVTDHIWVCRQLTLATWPGKLQIFHRRRWIPAMLNDKNRTEAGEGAAASGGILSGGFEWALWGSMKAAAQSYDTYEHVQAAEPAAEAKPKRKLKAVS